MTVPRLFDRRAPGILETDSLPVTLTLLSPMMKRRAPRSDVYLEMRAPTGRRYIVTSDTGLERLHTDDVYAATCIFDAYGSWDLTWHGLDNDETKRPEPLRVEVIQIDPEA